MYIEFLDRIPIDISKYCKRPPNKRIKRPTIATMVALSFSPKKILFNR